MVEAPREGKEHMESQESCPLEQMELWMCVAITEIGGFRGCSGGELRVLGCGCVFKTCNSLITL